MLSDFTKTIIRECAEQPKTNVYKTYTEVIHYCPSSGYTIEQVGKYLRRVKRAIIRSRVISAPSPHLSKKTLEEIIVRSNRG